MRRLRPIDNYLMEWIDRLGNEGFTFQDTEIKIYSMASPSPRAYTLDDNKDSAQLLITIHLYLTTGVILFQGHAFQFWAEKEFEILKVLTDKFANNHDTPTYQMTKNYWITLQLLPPLCRAKRSRRNLKSRMKHLPRKPKIVHRLKRS